MMKRTDIKHRTLINLIIFCFYSVAYSQTIIINNYPKVVPQGKKWILPTGQEILIEINGSSFQSGSKCNALLNSNPIFVRGVLEGNFNQPNEVYTILSSELGKVAYSNEMTFSIIPVRIIDSKFNMDELSYRPVKHVGRKQITFYPGQKVFVSECLKSIQLIEYNVSDQELAEIKAIETNKLIIEQQKEEESRFAEERIEKEEEERIKKEEEAKKLRLETEKRQKILSSSDYFNANDITNKTQLKLLVEQSLLGVLYEYILEFKRIHPTLYDTKFKAYKKNIITKSTDYYSMFNFSFCFNKHGQLIKVLNSGLFPENLESNNLELDTNWFNKLNSKISLNKSATVRLDNKEYEVNSCFFTYFNFFEKNSVGNIKIAVNKNNEISILENNSKLYNSDVISLLKASAKSDTLTKGKYIVNLNSNLLELKFIHFQKNDAIEIVNEDKEINEISSIMKL